MAYGVWYIEPSGVAREGDPVQRLKSDNEELEIMVREAVQNSLDARSGDEAVEVVLRLRELKGEEKADFLNALNAGVYLKELQDSRRYELFLSKHTQSSRPRPVAISESILDAFDVEKPEEPLRLLVIEDSGTVGLTGSELDYGQASRFCACCRDSEFSVRESGGNSRKSGGSYGKGKNVLWRHSESRLVLFYSHLTEPWKGHTSRFIGVGKLPWHADFETEDPESRRSGRCYFCADDQGFSILGEQADKVAKAVGLHGRKKRPGTSICLVGFEPRSVFEGRKWSDLAGDIQHIAETWYWPAIFDGRLTIRVVNEVEGTEHDVNPFEREDLRPFLEAWEGCESDSSELVKRKVLTLKVPRGPGDEPEAKAKYYVGCTLLDAEMHAAEAPRREPGSDRVALVRGFGMVVSYRDVRPRTIKATPYAGVCRGGLAIPNARISARDKPLTGEERVEMLLSSAEPPAHDQWNPAEISAQEWHGAQARIRDLLRTVESTITDLTSESRRREPGDTLPELSRLFRGPSAGVPKRTSRLSIESDGPPRKENGRLHYLVKIFPIGKKVPSDGLLDLRMRTEILDSAAGSITRGKGEAVQVVDVKIAGRSHANHLTNTKDGKECMLSVDLETNPLPLHCEVVAELPPAFSFPEGHYNLLVRAALPEERHGQV